jgi:hypothetical protein
MPCTRRFTPSGWRWPFSIARDRRLTQQLLEAPETKASRSAMPSGNRSVADFAASLAADRRMTRQWQRIGGDVRQGRYERAARELKAAFDADGAAAATWRGWR